MRIDDAEQWAWAYMASEQILLEGDRRAEDRKTSTQVLLMVAYVAGVKDAKNHP